VNEGTTTSSPGPTPIARSAIVIASVPFATPTPCAAPQ
jgi:transcription initiation factor TFIIIB Brf1 subunit/transcription initiation factor TFIIB